MIELICISSAIIIPKWNDIIIADINAAHSTLLSPSPRTPMNIYAVPIGLSTLFWSSIYRVSHKKLHSFSKKITLILEKNYTRSRKKLHSFSKKITLILEKNYTHSRKKLHSFSKKITLVLEKNYTHSRKKLHSFSKKITLKFE